MRTSFYAVALAAVIASIGNASFAQAQSAAKASISKGGSMITVYFPRPWFSIDMPEALKERTKFVLDGREIGRVGLGERITARVPSGTHYLRQDLTWFPSIAGALGVKGEKLSFAGQHRYIRVAWIVNHYEYSEVSEARGRAEAAKCKPR